MMHPRHMFVLAASCAAIATSCAARAPRPAPTDEARSPASTDAPPPAPPASPEQPESPADEPAPVPALRLAWVNPARCVTPCTYDPEESLVRVDDQGDVDPAGGHRVHRSVQAPLRDLVSAARAAGHKVRIESAFRSYDEQALLFKRVKQVGRAARPGHSEHQLGTAVDFRLPTTAAITWLAEHAPTHGFALSYPDGKQRLTGYRPEPWHVRFVGPELAKELRTSGQTLEEVFRARPELGESGRCDDCPRPASRKDCGAITTAGRCDGTVLAWCYDGALATVDCAAFKQRCGRTAKESDCVAK